MSIGNNDDFISDAERLETASEWLQRLQDAPQDEQVLADWLQWCSDPKNHDAFDRISAVWRALDTPQVAAALRRPVPLARHRHQRRRLRVAALAVSVAACMLISFSVPREASEEQRLTYSTGRAENKSELLADGSRIDLGALSRVEVRYSASRREISLYGGEAYFNVAKDHSRPFVVTAGSLQVTAVGTQFNVRRAAQDAVVTVSEGRVKVESPNTPAIADTKLDAGQQARYLAVADQIAIASVNPDMASSWRMGVLKFVDEPLDAVIATVNRYSRRQISLEDDVASKLIYTGTVYDARIDEWIAGLSQIYPLHVVHQDADRVALAATIDEKSSEQRSP
jgi:transmembrane sensor